MSPNRHSISAVPTAKNLKTPLKASAVLLTSMILAACNTTDEPSYNLDGVFSPSQSIIDKQLEEAKAAKEKAEAEAKAAKDAADDAAKEAAEKIAEAEKAAKAEAEAAKKALEDAEKAKEDAEKATADAIKAKEEAEKALEDALANGGGSEALQKEAERKAKLAEEAKVAAEAAQANAQAAQQQAQAQVSAAAAAQKDAQDAATAAEIKNKPESTKSGVQSLNVNVSPLNKVYNTTTRDFEATDNSIIARADIASESAPGKGDGLLGKLPITTSGEGDTDVAGSNGFKAHKDNAIVAALGQELPLAYTSTYKDFGDDMRIGHIDGKAVFSGVELPVSGVAVVGNATQAANMPTEGKVGYTGDATYRKLGIGNAIEFGTSVFTADFVAKNVKGDLTFDKAGTIGLTAGINGNQFSGSADANGGYLTEGGFFGGDAQYLGGVYEGNGAQGTYGAKSDKQTAAEKAAKDAKAAADKAQAAIADAQAAADKAQAVAEQAQADAAKAKADAEKAQAAADNAGTGGDDQALQDALDRAEAAEEAVKQAKAEADKAKAEADKAKADAQDAAQKLVDAANAEAEAAKKAAEQAQADAAKAKEDAEKAQNLSKEEAEAAKKAAEEAEARAEAAELKAQEAADKAKAAVEKAKADADARVVQAQKAAAEAAKKSEEKLAAAEKAKADAIAAKEAAEKALEEVLAGGGSEVLQKEADRKAKLAEEAEAAADAAEAAANTAQQEAEAEATAAAAAQQAAKNAAAAAEIKNAAETAKSGVQHISINATGVGQGILTTTTRDFSITDETQVDARADEASEGLVSAPVALQVSGDNDAEVADSNGFKSFENTTKVNTATLGEQDLVYTSTYKDFSDELRVAHIDGAAAGLLPVNGVAVVGNATEAANVPTEGKVGYTGEATYRALGADSTIEFGSSVFTADFVAKNVKGDLTFSDKTIGLEGTIDGNKFSGTKDGYNADGGFYGGDAQYLGGVYEGNGAQGTYGAKSDNQTAAEQAAKDTESQAESAEKALAAAQVEAAEAQATAEQAQADAAKAKEAAEKAQEAADNAASNGNEEALQEALDRAEAAEAAAKKAKEDADAAIKAAAEKAQEEVKAAQDQAQLEVEAAKAELATAQAEKQEAVKAAEKAKADAETAIGDAQSEADKKVAEAEGRVEAANEAEEKALAEKTAAEQKAQDLQAKLDSMPKFSYAETKQSGVQHLSVDASALQVGVKTTTTRDFEIRSTSDVDARADLALTGVLPGPITIQVSGDNDAETENGFKAYEGTGNVTGEGDLAYIATYKDFGDGAMRIAHIDGTAANGAVPVDGVAVVGNKTATLPSEGTFDYAGDATNRKVGVDNAIEYGSSEFTADFVASKVDGTLKFAQAGEIGLSADITGNEFSGAAADDTGYNTEGAFYGKDANFIGGIYEGNGSQGTFGAEKDGIPADLVVPVDLTPVEPTDPADTNITGFQSTALSSKERELPFGQGQLDSAIGYSAIRGDKDTWSGDQADVGADGTLPADKVLNTGDNFTAFDTLSLRADMVKPQSVQQALTVNPKQEGVGTVGVEAGKGSFNPDFKYNAVYESFGTQMQTGHVYGFINSGVAGDVSRVANVYVQGNLTSQAYMDYLSEVNDGKAQYSGIGTATYIENIHLDDFGTTVSGANWAATPTEGAITAPVKGDAAFNVDFVNSKLEGTLSFDAGDYKYMPANNEIKIEADITGNTFAGNNGIDTAGGFYGDKAEFLGGIYQDAGDVAGGKGAGAGTGTKFQGTFGAEKQ
ncbi:transferrin-binding protein-like solute binding protein [Psychrobacter okhotskensis]|uniref:transferrin-binding protein-like solute binding protein n=1 Tax=Psychrobacter okhotskensis TaxID=212403 RepID=UPI003D01B000